MNLPFTSPWGFGADCFDIGQLQEPSWILIGIKEDPFAGSHHDFHKLMELITSEPWQKHRVMLLGRDGSRMFTFLQSWLVVRGSAAIKHIFLGMQLSQHGQIAEQLPYMLSLHPFRHFLWIPRLQGEIDLRINALINRNYNEGKPVQAKFLDWVICTAVQKNFTQVQWYDKLQAQCLYTKTPFYGTLIQEFPNF